MVGLRSLCLLCALLLAGCQAPLRMDEAPAGNVAFELAAAPAPAPGELAARRARSLIGTPYRFGAASPAHGFDCSGLVQYSYREAAGVTLPRNTSELRLATQRIERGELRPGDLIFFRLRGPNGHVGIYAGDGRFVHAPSRGKKVRVEHLDAPFWQRKYSEVRRPVL